jgi:predicted ATP-binding protein involved in virulence
MRLLEVSFHFFKIFKEAQILLPASNIAVFIGENGKGKTSLLEGVAILLNEWVQQMKYILKTLPPSSFEDWKKKEKIKARRYFSKTKTRPKDVLGDLEKIWAYAKRA